MGATPLATRWLSLLFVASTLFGCGASSSSGEAAGAGGAGGSDTGGACAADGTAETYSPGMTATGANGQIKVSLESIAPAPAEKGTNEWRLLVTDMNGAPLDGVTVVPKPYMPVHMHGTSIVPVVTPMGDGNYDITSLVLFMPGLWQVTFAVSAPGVVDSAAFTFCVPG